MGATDRTLEDVKRAAAMDHILTAARRYCLDNGLDSSMERLADAAGVSRRTLFRMFGTREKMLAAALDAGMIGYKRELPAYDGDVESWLKETCATAHRLNAPVGSGFWELTFRTDLPADIVAIEEKRRRNFRKVAEEVAQVLWKACSGEDEPPAELVAAVGAHLSPFYTAAVTKDLGRGWRVAADLAYDAVMSATRRLMN